MRKTKSLVLAVIGLLCSMSVSAYDFEVDGIYYDITSSDFGDLEVEVTYDDWGNSYSGLVTIPQSVTYYGSTYSVTSIGSYAFYSCTGLTSINIPESVKYISDDAFYSCTGLTSINIPESVKYISDDAFYSCTGLTSIVVAPSNPKYDSRENCNAIIESESNMLIVGCQSSTIPNSVTCIGSNAFSGCSSLTSITIPNSVTSIGSYAFYSCTGLISINIPESVKYISDDAFNSCTGLTSIVVAPSNPKYDSRENCNAIIESESNMLIVGCQSSTIPNSVTCIGSNAFSGCSSLTSITIPNSVTSIGRSAFFGCSDLTSINIPESVTKIGYHAFSYCSSLISIVVAAGNLVYDSRDNCNAIIESESNTLIVGCQNSTIPNSVTCIGGGAFYGCFGLTSINIPESVTSIGDDAFFNCI